MLHFLIADNIPLAEEVFAPFGHIERFGGREPEPRQLEKADVLMVRSITEVNEQLLSYAPNLKFVGTATIGTEHLDKAALKKRQIPWVGSPGANADSVGEYVLTALLAVAMKLEWALSDKRVVIIGAGHTGQATGRRLTALGLQVDYFDPPRAQQEPDFKSIAWEEALTADIISLHVPLTSTGTAKTKHLFDAAVLSQLTSKQVLINASRGAVIDNQALLKRQQEKPLHLILDVWEGEPDVLTELIDHTIIATPHIAGHSLNGKIRGTQMLYDACRAQFDWRQKAPNWAELFPAPPGASWRCSRMPSHAQLSQWLLENYDIWHDDHSMRTQGIEAVGFDQLRRQYPVRFELCSHTLDVAASVNEATRQRLHDLGFNF